MAAAVTTTITRSAPTCSDMQYHVLQHSSSTALMPHINMDDTHRNLEVGH